MEFSLYPCVYMPMLVGGGGVLCVEVPLLSSLQSRMTTTYPLRIPGEGGYSCLSPPGARARSTIL